MNKECELLADCGFYKKYRITRELGLFQLYCKGPKMIECERKKYHQKNGNPPTDDLMPSGKVIVTC